MKFTDVLVAAALLGPVSAYYLDKTCSNIKFESSTNVLELDCNNRQGKPIHQTFDLDTCLGWDSSSKSIVYGFNFGEHCKSCYTEQRLDVSLEGVYTHIICTCDGIANIVRDLGAEAHLGNIDGVLTCCQYAC